MLTIAAQVAPRLLQKKSLQPPIIYAALAKEIQFFPTEATPITSHLQLVSRRGGGEKEAGLPLFCAAKKVVAAVPTSPICSSLYYTIYVLLLLPRIQRRAGGGEGGMRKVAVVEN